MIKYHLFQKIKNISPKNISPRIIATITDPIAPKKLIIAKNTIASTQPIAPVIIPDMKPVTNDKIDQVVKKLATALIQA